LPTSNPNSADRELPFTFHFGPFRFQSEIDIPELRSSTGPGQRLVTLRLGPAPAEIPGAVRDLTRCQLTSNEYLLDIPGTARYYVRGGNEVLVDIALGAPIANVSTFLLGSVFGVLCHQNGYLPLHASAVEFDGAVTAFLGSSGAGKSTLAACLRRRGHTIVADDICLLEPGSQSESATQPPRVVPVAGWLKLWNQSLDYLGETPLEQDRVFSTDDKFRVFLSDAADAPLALQRIVFLVRNEDPDARPAVEPMPLLEAIGGLMEQTYAGYVPLLTGGKSQLFQRCARVFQNARPLRLTIPWRLDRLDSVLDLLDAQVFRPMQVPK
jgi:energy-coupling factor transporter ATP-binding protein EcfA2